MFLSRRAFIGSAVAASVAPSLSFAQAAQQVRVGYIPILGAAPLFVADKEGFAKAAGLDFRMTVFESGPNMISALASGTPDIPPRGGAAARPGHPHAALAQDVPRKRWSRVHGCSVSPSAADHPPD